MKKLLVLLVLLATVGCKRLSVNGLERNPGGRAFWSFLIPGVGQVQNEDGGKATLLLALEILNYATYYQQEEEDRSDERLYSVMGVLRLWGASDAYSRAQQLNETKPFGIMPIYPAADVREPEPTPLQIVLDPLGKRVAATLTCRF
ncbi:MAG: hypothetical protein ACYTKD_20075 [Planctomycetota bacterium]|jgi:hypothetical protein